MGASLHSAFCAVFVPRGTKAGLGQHQPHGYPIEGNVSRGTYRVNPRLICKPCELDQIDSVPDVPRETIRL